MPIENKNIQNGFGAGSLRRQGPPQAPHPLQHRGGATLEKLQQLCKGRHVPPVRSVSPQGGAGSSLWARQRHAQVCEAGGDRVLRL